MPSRKILFALIICVGIVTSVYLLGKNSKNIPLSTQGANKTSGISANSYINLNGNTNSDWQKILVNIDSNKSTTTILTNTDPDAFDETTLTAQMSRDFFSQYLSAIKDGPITSDRITKIAENTLSSPAYFPTGGAVYIASNLHVTTNTDLNTFRTYQNTLIEILRERSSQVKENPLTIYQDAVNYASELKLAKLDPIILNNKGLLTDLLNINVPTNAIKIHLALLNAANNTLSDLEGMRALFTDPVRSLVAIKMYQQHILDLMTAMENVNKFFTQI